MQQQLTALREACASRDVASFPHLAAEFVKLWQPHRAMMETDEAFIDETSIETFAVAFGESDDFSWHALKVSCLLARNDQNTKALLSSGGVAAALAVLRASAHTNSDPAAQLEVSLALLQNVAYSSEGVASILRENGVQAVLHAMRTHAAVAAVQRMGLGVLWNLCDSDEHWVAFLREGPSLVTVLLQTLAHHPNESKIEESVIDMLWDFSSTGDGQAHIIASGGVPPILQVMGSAECADELQKKALSMLWNLTISAAGISALVQHAGVATVLSVMRTHGKSEEVQQNALGVLRNISDAPEGQTGILRAAGLPLLLETMRQHAMCDEIVELSLECLANVAQSSVQHAVALLLEGGVEALHAPRLVNSAAHLRRRLVICLEGASPLLGALMHATTTSSEAKSCIVVALALFTMPPTSVAALDKGSGADGDGSPSAVHRHRRGLASPSGNATWHGAFWPLGGPGGWHEDGVAPAQPHAGPGGGGGGAGGLGGSQHAAGRGAAAASHLGPEPGDANAQSPQRQQAASSAEMGGGGGGSSGGGEADEFLGLWAASLLIDEGGLSHLMQLLAHTDASLRVRAAIGLRHLLSVTAVAEPPSNHHPHPSPRSSAPFPISDDSNVHPRDFIPEPAAVGGGSNGMGGNGGNRPRRGVLPGGWRQAQASGRGVGGVPPPRAASAGPSSMLNPQGGRTPRGPRLSPQAAASAARSEAGSVGGRHANASQGGVGGGVGSLHNSPAATPLSTPSPSQRLHDFAGWLDDEETSDVLFEVEGNKLHAHRIVLLCSKASEVFRAMLRHPMREATSSAAIQVEGISYDVFRLLVSYLYTGEVDVPPHLAAPLLLAAERYMVYPLQLECAHTLVQQALNNDNLWEMLSVAASLSLPAPPEQPPEPSPSEVLRDAAVQFLCDGGADLPRMVGADEFVGFAEELIPRIHELLHARLTFLLRQCKLPYGC